MNQRFKIQISNRPGFGIQILYEPYLCTYKSQMGFKFQSGDSGFTIFFEGGIQDSNLNPRKMAGIQDSNLVFKGPTSSL